mmetsp:Transcript_24261/g.66732  ORF Transcript_24261/g.66732 Transcript_24261/m.66732 type:complete len:318 (+) Transcript_24261:487-1440(+)
MCATPRPLANRPPRHQAMVAIQVVCIAVVGKRGNHRRGWRHWDRSRGRHRHGVDDRPWRRRWLRRARGGVRRRRRRLRGAAAAVVLTAPVLLRQGPEPRSVAPEQWRCRGWGRRRCGCYDGDRSGGDVGIGDWLLGHGHEQVDQRRDQQEGEHADAAFPELPAVESGGHLLVIAAAPLADVVVSLVASEGATAWPDILPARVCHCALSLATGSLQATTGACALAGARAASAAAPGHRAAVRTPGNESCSLALIAPEPSGACSTTRDHATLEGADACRTSRSHATLEGAGGCRTLMGLHLHCLSDAAVARRHCKLLRQ